MDVGSRHFSFKLVISYIGGDGGPEEYFKGNAQASLA